MMSLSNGRFLLIFLGLLPLVIRSYDLSNEGYSNLVRNSDRPNEPFNTDTNRYADGFTSAGSIESTSTHFAPYTGAIANVSDRYLRYTEYKANAVLQGIATYGAGDAVKEDAQYAITSQPGYENLPAPNKTFPVYAAIKWNPSNFAIQEGEYYNITVFGAQEGFSSQFWYDGGIRVNAEGYTSFYDAVSNCYIGLGRCRSHLKKRRRLATANWMALACSIGEFVRPAGEFEVGTEHLSTSRYYPLDEAVLQSTIFLVGQSIYFRATHTGQLICFANDAHTLYWNNKGSIQVTATRVSWPPKNAHYYQDQYLPACDSAIAVYANFGFAPGDPNLPMKCNPNGNGAGWRYSNVIAKSARYGSGEPSFLLQGA